MADEWLITRADLSRAIRNLHQITVVPRGEAAVRGEAFDPSILAHDILREVDKLAAGDDEDDEELCPSRNRRGAPCQKPDGHDGYCRNGGYTWSRPPADDPDVLMDPLDALHAMEAIRNRVTDCAWRTLIQLFTASIRHAP